jgi:hypothetical protein
VFLAVLPELFGLALGFWQTNFEIALCAEEFPEGLFELWGAA